MGNCLAGVFRRRKIRRHIVLILIGLDNAGKTRTVNNLSGEKDDNVLPTVGFKAVNLTHKDTPVTIYDLGGGPHFRQIWTQYYSEVHGVIFVIDSSDFSRLDECKEVLEEVLSHDKISGKPVLILANKQDKSGALDDLDMVEKLNIEPLVNRYRCPTLVESYSATNLETKGRKPKIDPGLRKGYQWLLNYIVRRYGDINLRVQTDIHGELERRKRLLTKASNQASQTSISEEVATETGFENPNFSLTRDKRLDRGLIIVKPIINPNSLDTTITIESNDSGIKPKLSPLFGQSNDSTIESTRVELEPKMQLRKLSPIVKNRSQNAQNEDFSDKHHHSSPTITKKIETEPTSKESSLLSEDLKSKEQLHSSCGDGNRTWDVDKRHRVLINDAELSAVHREVVLTERDYSSKGGSLDMKMSCTLPAPRPASASMLIRRQLEFGHKRRNSLRYIHRNKTSPERVSMMLYQPRKTVQRQDKGDFQHQLANNIN